MLIEIFFQFRCYFLQYLLYNMKQIDCDINLYAKNHSLTVLNIYQLVYKENKPYKVEVIQVHNELSSLLIMFWV